MFLIKKVKYVSYKKFEYKNMYHGKVRSPKSLLLWFLPNHLYILYYFKYTLKILYKCTHFYFKNQNWDQMLHTSFLHFFYSTGNTEHFSLDYMLSCFIIFNGSSISLCGDIMISLTCNEYLSYFQFHYGEYC